MYAFSSRMSNWEQCKVALESIKISLSSWKSIEDSSQTCFQIKNKDLVLLNEAKSILISYFGENFAFSHLSPEEVLEIFEK